MIRRARARCSLCGKAITLPLYQIGPDETVPSEAIECIACSDLTVDEVRADARAWRRSGLHGEYVLKATTTLPDGIESNIGYWVL